MWEEETVVLITTLTKRLLDDKEEVKYRKIVEDKDLPKHIKKFFKNRVKRYFQEETPLEFKSTPHFKLNTDNIKEYKDKLITIFWEGAIFPKEEVEEILKEALTIRLNYLIKPIDTIRRLLFGDRDNISLDEMDQILTSFKTILPYAEIIIKECGRQGKSLVDKNIFSNIATEQLQNVYKDDTVKTVLRDFSVLTDFLSEIKGEEINYVEGKALQEFFADRNLWGFRRALDVEMKIDGKVFSADNLEIVIKRYIELKNEFEVSHALDTQEEELPLKEEDEKENIQQKTVEEEDKTNIPIEEEILEDIQRNNSTTETLNWELEEITEKSKNQAKGEKEKVDTTKKERKKNKHMRIIRRDEDSERGEEEDKEKGVKKEIEKLDLGLRDLIDTKMERGFIKKLFDNNSKAYEDVIEKLNKVESWREAKVLIDNELFKRDVDPFSREAIKLVDLVYGIFYPEEGVGGK